MARKTTRRGRKKKKRFLLIRFALKSLLLFALFGGIGWPFYHYVTESPRFHIRNVQVEGASILQEEAILAVAGITQDDNVLFFDPEAIAEKVCAIPRVKTCQVSRVWPDLVIIRLEERTAFATILVNNHLFEIDGEGVVLSEIEDIRNWPGPLITDVPGMGYTEPGMCLEEPELQTALAFWRIWSATPLALETHLSEISAADKDCIKVFFDEIDCETRWGRSDFRQQAERFAVLWQHLDGEIDCKEYLDMRFDRDLVCR